jgi:hypothetical protein
LPLAHTEHPRFTDALGAVDPYVPAPHVLHRVQEDPVKSFSLWYSKESHGVHPKEGSNKFPAEQVERPERANNNINAIMFLIT